MPSSDTRRCTPDLIIEVMKSYCLCNDIINLIVNFCFWETTYTGNAILLPDRKVCTRLNSTYWCSDDDPCGYLLFFIDRNNQYKIPIERVLKQIYYTTDEYISDLYDSYESINHRINIYKVTNSKYIYEYIKESSHEGTVYVLKFEKSVSAIYDKHLSMIERNLFLSIDPSD